MISHILLHNKGMKALESLLIPFFLTRVKEGDFSEGKVADLKETKR